MPMTLPGGYATTGASPSPINRQAPQQLSMPGIQGGMVTGSKPPIARGGFMSAVPGVGLSPGAVTPPSPIPNGPPPGFAGGGMPRPPFQGVPGGISPQMGQMGMAGIPQGNQPATQAMQGQAGMQGMGQNPAAMSQMVRALRGY